MGTSTNRLYYACVEGDLFEEVTVLFTFSSPVCMTGDEEHPDQEPYVDDFYNAIYDALLKKFPNLEELIDPDVGIDIRQYGLQE